MAALRSTIGAGAPPPTVLGQKMGGVVFRVARDGAALEVGFRCEEVHALDGVLGAFAAGNVSDGTEMQRTPSEGEGLFLEVGVCKMLEHGSLSLSGKRPACAGLSDIGSYSPMTFFSASKS